MNDSDQPRPARRPRSARTWGVVLGTMVVAGLVVASFGSFAGAADDTTGGTDAAATTPATGGPRLHPQLTDEQKQCLADQGVTLPTKPADGTRPTPPSEEQRAAMRAAAETCGLPARADGPGGPGGPGGFGRGGPGGPRLQLTDEQKQCLADQGVTPPTKPADGTRPTPPTDEQRAAMRAAAEACGLPTQPARPAAVGTTA